MAPLYIVTHYANRYTFVNRNIYASNQSHYMEYYDPRLYVSSWLGLEHWGVTWNVNNVSVSNVDEVDGILRY